MARSVVLMILAVFAVGIIGLWTITRSPDCRPDGVMLLQVGETHYRVPAWMDPYPDVDRGLPRLAKSSYSQWTKGFSYFCQTTSTSIIKTRGFDFQARPRSVRSGHPFNTPRIISLSQLSPAYRPTGNPLDWRNIRSATYEPRIVSADGNSATIFFTLHFRSGGSRRLKARCLYGVHSSAELKGKEYVQRCTTIVPIEGQNALEINVNPGDDPAAIGRELIESLRAVEVMTRRNTT